MPARRMIHLVAALALLAASACAPPADREQQRALREAALARVPANAPAGVFATGTWNGGSMRGESRAVFTHVGVVNAGQSNLSTVPRLGFEQMREFTVESYAWRDSARVAFVFEGYTNGRTAVRQFPRSMQVTGDTMTFELPYLFGWDEVDCRLVAHGRAWRGNCRSPQGDRVAVVELELPRVAAR